MRTTHGLNIIDHCETCPHHGDGFFCHLSMDALKELDHLKLISAYPEGATLFMEGQEPRGAYVVCQGVVKVYTTSNDARTIILRIAGPGDVVGMNSTIRKKAYEASAETLQPCQVAFIPSDRFRELVAHFPEIAMNAAEVMSSACTVAYDQIKSLGLTGSAKEKLALFLLDLAKTGRPARTGQRSP